MEKSTSYGHHPDIDSTTSRRCQETRPERKCATVESLVTNKKETSQDKSCLCKVVSHNTKLLPTSDLDCPSKGKDFYPYWNPSVAEMSKKLWLPIKTDLLVLEQNSLNGLSSTTVGNSWFSATLAAPQSQSLHKTYSQSSTYSPVEFTDSGNTVLRSKKIRIYPNAEQRAILCKYFGVNRYMFNQTIEYLKEKGTVANWRDIRSWLMDKVPDWLGKAPYEVKSMAIRDACLAVKAAKVKCVQTGTYQEVKFRSRKDLNQGIFIPARSVRSFGVYYTVIGHMYFSEKVADVKHDCRLVLQSGRYFLIVPTERSVLMPENQRRGVVACDPGVRTFITLYSEDVVGKIGRRGFEKITRLCHHLDSLLSRLSKKDGCVGARKRYRIKKAVSRVRWRIKNLISEIHHKTATFLCKSFDNVVIPPFEVQGMVSKLRSKTARAMMTWAHYQFRQTLIHTAEIYSSVVWIQNEAYTSKTCSACGTIKNIGGSKVMKCDCCGLRLDRDVNGARGIMLKALEDTPSLATVLKCNC